MKAKYRIRSREEGRGPAYTESFRTLAEAQAYIRAQWQGPEYIDGPAAFHTDYCTFHLVGFTLADVGKRQWIHEADYSYPDWVWTDLSPARTDGGAPWDPSTVTNDLGL